MGGVNHSGPRSGNSTGSRPFFLLRSLVLLALAAEDLQAEASASWLHAHLLYSEAPGYPVWHTVKP